MTTRELAILALEGLLVIVTSEHRSGVWLAEVFPVGRTWTREMIRVYERARKALWLGGWHHIKGWRGEAETIRRAINVLVEAPR